MPDTVEVIGASQGLVADLADLTAAELIALWDQLDQWDATNATAFAEAATPLIEASAQSAAATSVALVATLHDIPTPATDMAAVVSARLDRLRDPFNAYGHALRVGRPWEEAIEVGRSTAGQVGTDAAYQAARDAMVHMDTPTLGDVWRPRSPSQQRPTRYERQNWDRPAWPRWGRVLTGQSCSWCQFFSTRDYFSAETATFGHNRCDCLVVPKSQATDDHNDAIRRAAGFDEKRVTRELAAFKRRRRTAA